MPVTPVTRKACNVRWQLFWLCTHRAVRRLSPLRVKCGAMSIQPRWLLPVMKRLVALMIFRFETNDGRIVSVLRMQRHLVDAILLASNLEPGQRRHRLPISWGVRQWTAIVRMTTNTQRPGVLTSLMEIRRPAVQPTIKSARGVVRSNPCASIHIERLNVGMSRSARLVGGRCGVRGAAVLLVRGQPWPPNRVCKRRSGPSNPKSV